MSMRTMMGRVAAAVLGAVGLRTMVDEPPRTVHMLRPRGTPRPQYIKNQRQRRRDARRRGYR